MHAVEPSEYSIIYSRRSIEVQQPPIRWRNTMPFPPSVSRPVACIALDHRISPRAPPQSAHTLTLTATTPHLNSHVTQGALECNPVAVAARQLTRRKNRIAPPANRHRLQPRRRCTMPVMPTRVPSPTLPALRGAWRPGTILQTQRRSSRAYSSFPAPSRPATRR